MIHQLGGNLIPVMAIGCSFVTFTLWIVMATIDSLYKTRCTSRLKERLIEKGHSPGEIDQYLRAGSDTGHVPVKGNQPRPPVKNRAYSSLN